MGINVIVTISWINGIRAILVNTSYVHVDLFVNFDFLAFLHVKRLGFCKWSGLLECNHYFGNAVMDYRCGSSATER